MPLTEDPACNPGMCLDWELNPQPLGLQAGAQFTESNQPELLLFLLIYLTINYLMKARHDVLSKGILVNRLLGRWWLGVDVCVWWGVHSIVM